jgi:hypothetical protein
MSERFDPNIPADPSNPTAPAIEGAFTGVVTVTEQPTIGQANLVVNRAKSFDIKVSWHIFGNLTPLWLKALSVDSPNWVVTAYAESQGPGPEVSLGSVNVPVGTAFSQDMSYTATLTVPANTLPEEDPGNPNESGVYKITVTTFLDSDLGPVGYDMIGYSEGPFIKVENPL